MIRYSDNTATNLVVDQIGLPTTNATMESLGFLQTGLNSKVYRGDTTISLERSRQYGLGSTTARAMVNLLEKLHAEKIASTESCEAMVGHLLPCDDKVLLHKLPKGTKVAHKSGAVSNSRCNAGVVYGPSGNDMRSLWLNISKRDWLLLWPLPLLWPLIVPRRKPVKIIQSRQSSIL